jgi:hypothetical protein
MSLGLAGPPGVQKPILQGGNTLGANLIIGPLDANGITFLANGAKVASLSSSGAATLENATNSTNAFDVENAIGTGVFGVDTLNGRVGIGTVAPDQELSLGSGDANFLLPSIPSGVSAISSNSGGSLPAATYYYRIVGADGAGGLSLPSTEVSAGVTGTTGTVTISWPSVAGADGGYRVYRGTASGGENVYYAIAAGTTTFTDTGGAAISGTPPTSDTGSSVLLNGSSNGGASYIDTGNVGIGTPAPMARLNVATGNGSNVGEIVTGASGQSADLFDVSSATAGNLFSVGATGSVVVQPAVDTTTALRANNAAGQDLLDVDATNSAVQMSAHVITGNSSGTTQVVADTAAGSGAPISLSGDDTVGTVTLTSGTGSTGGNLATITFAHSYGAIPHVLLSPNDFYAPSLELAATDVTTGGFTVYTRSAVQASQPISFTYLVLQ